MKGRVYGNSVKDVLDAHSHYPTMNKTLKLVLDYEGKYNYLVPTNSKIDEIYPLVDKEIRHKQTLPIAETFSKFYPGRSTESMKTNEKEQGTKEIYVRFEGF